MPSRNNQHATITVRRPAFVNWANVRITINQPNRPPIQLTLGLTTHVVGTGPDCDIVVTDPRVSHKHCEIALDNRRGIILRDLKSKNGTFIGETEIVEAVLAPGATATLGNTRLVADIGGHTLVPVSSRWQFGEALGESLPMSALFAQLEIVAPTSQTILLLGESGTGKEVIARAIHSASVRRQGPFVVFDCGAVAPSLIDAELFGYVRGAFTGAERDHPGLLEQASGGTLFLDEIGELPLDLQPKLLRAIESRQVRRLGSTDSSRLRSVDIRIIAATHRDLRARIADGTFREDLYYRIAVMVHVVPPLRDRKDDIPLLVEHFLASQVPPRTLADLPPNTLDLLAAHQWPGNVRELRNIVARLSVFPNQVREIMAPTAQAVAPTNGGSNPMFRMTLPEAREVVKEQFERTYVTEKLRENGGNVTRAADASGISRQWLHQLMVQYGIKSNEF